MVYAVNEPFYIENYDKISEYGYKKAKIG